MTNAEIRAALEAKIDPAYRISDAGKARFRALRGLFAAEGRSETP